MSPPDYIDATIAPLDHLPRRGEPGAPALVLRGRTLSYAELELRVGQMAGWLQERMPTNGRVASWARKDELACLLPLAAARAGLVHVPINPLLKRMQVAHILADSGAALLIANRARLETLTEDDMPPDCRLLAEDDVWKQVDDRATLMGPSAARADDVAAILYTSGSSGPPKGVVLSHRNLWLGAASVAAFLRIAADDVTLAVLPLSFDYGQNQLLSTWYAGGRVVPLDYLSASDVVKACARHRVTTIAGVPPLWTQLLEARWPGEATTTVRRLTNSGGALTRTLIAAMRRTFPGADVVPMYGLTEAFRSTYLPPALVEDHPTSIGSAVPFAEILVVNDNGDEAVSGEEGELVHCGPLVAQGYWRDPHRTAERFRPAPPWSRYGGTAVWSGDRVRRDAQGLLHFVGRRDAMIKSAGNRISPDEVEDAALSSGMVAEAAAFGLPDAEMGQVVHLVVRMIPSHKVAEDEAIARLQQYLARVLPTFMQPREIHARAELPRSANGKIDRVSLRDAVAGQPAEVGA